MATTNYTDTTTTSSGTTSGGPSLKPFDAYTQQSTYANDIPDTALIDWVNNNTDTEIHSLNMTITVKTDVDGIDTYCKKLLMNSTEVMSVSYFIKNDVIHKLMQRVIPTFCSVTDGDKYALISLNRNIFKNGIDISSSGMNYNFVYNTDKYCKFGSFNTTYQAHGINKVTLSNNIYTDTGTNVGYIWSNLGIMVLNLSHGGAVPSEVTDHAGVANLMIQTVSNGVVTAGAADWTKIKSKNFRKLRTYFVRIPHNRFNKTTNATWTSTTFATNKTTYITGIGLYSGNTLLAIAKLNKPIIKSNEKEYNIQIKIDMTGN